MLVEMSDSESVIFKLVECNRWDHESHVLKSVESYVEKRVQCYHVLCVGGRILLDSEHFEFQTAICVLGLNSQLVCPRLLFCL